MSGSREPHAHRTPGTPFSCCTLIILNEKVLFSCLPYTRKVLNIYSDYLFVYATIIFYPLWIGQQSTLATLHGRAFKLWYWTLTKFTLLKATTLFSLLTMFGVGRVSMRCHDLVRELLRLVAAWRANKAERLSASRHVAEGWKKIKSAGLGQPHASFRRHCIAVVLPLHRHWGSRDSTSKYFDLGPFQPTFHTGQFVSYKNSWRTNIYGVFRFTCTVVAEEWCT